VAYSPYSTAVDKKKTELRKRVYPFGSSAIFDLPGRSVAFRPGLTPGLALS
jgi:hypothetical protein